MKAGEFRTSIGLEIHVELSTATKLFCSCPNRFGAPPNTLVCPVCLGEPGSLPVLNARALEYALRIGLALGAEVAPRALFHRKNYFYPDMPKNFQISQYDLPLCRGGSLTLETPEGEKVVGIERIHLEEDTGKTLHPGETGRIYEATYALLDYNRAGVPLVEVVTRPEISSPEEARLFVAELREVLLALGVSDARMEEGSLRVDSNISVGIEGRMGTKVEVKNLNSLRSLRRALEYEERRQKEILSAGGEVVQETRHFDERSGTTVSLRAKEEAFDYRYFPEPDLVPVEPDPGWIKDLRASLPELPRERRARLASLYGLSRQEAALLVSTPGLAVIFEDAVREGANARSAYNWLSGEFLGLCNARGVEPGESGLTGRALAQLLRFVERGAINLRQAKEVLAEMLETGRDPQEIVEERGLSQLTDLAFLKDLARKVVENHPEEARRYRAGQVKVLSFLVGQAMRLSEGRANPALLKQALEEVLKGQGAV